MKNKLNIKKTVKKLKFTTIKNTPRLASSLFNMHHYDYAIAIEKMSRS